MRYDTVRIDDDPVYVDPRSVQTDAAGRTLILGEYTHRFSRTTTGWVARDDAPRFGIMIRSDGRAEVVRPPLPDRYFIGASAVPNGNGWAVVFAESDRAAADGPFPDAGPLWYGEYDGSRWGRLERIPVPEARLVITRASRLIRTRDGLARVFPTESGLLWIVRLRDGVWAGEHVLTPAPKAEMLATPAGDLLLATIQSDTTLRRNDSNSLLLRSEPGHWALREVLSSGQTEPVRNMDAWANDTLATLTWQSRGPPGESAVRALVLQADRDRQIVTVDSGTTWPAPLAPEDIPGAGLVWATLRTDAAGKSEIGLRYLSPDGRTDDLAALANPFVAGFRPARRGRNLVLVGSLFSEPHYVATLLIEFATQCGRVHPWRGSSVPTSAGRSGGRPGRRSGGPDGKTRG